MIYVHMIAINTGVNVQAYHNELVNKVSRLEEDNLKLKKEKVGI